MISDQPFLSYPHSEFAEAFKRAGARPADADVRTFMSPWFEQRYPKADEQAAKFRVFLAICDYVDEFRETLAGGGVITIDGPVGSDIIPGSLTAVLLSHFCVDLVPPKPEQVIAATRKRLDRLHERT